MSNNFFCFYTLLNYSDKRDDLLLHFKKEILPKNAIDWHYQLAVTQAWRGLLQERLRHQNPCFLSFKVFLSLTTDVVKPNAKATEINKLDMSPCIRSPIYLKANLHFFLDEIIISLTSYRNNSLPQTQKRHCSFWSNPLHIFDCRNRLHKFEALYQRTNGTKCINMRDRTNVKPFRRNDINSMSILIFDKWK